MIKAGDRVYFQEIDPKTRRFRTAQRDDLGVVIDDGTGLRVLWDTGEDDAVNPLGFGFIGEDLGAPFVASYLRMPFVVRRATTSP